MRSLARPRAPMRAAASKTQSQPTPTAGQKRPGDGTCDDAQAAARGSAAGRLGTTAEFVAAQGGSKPLKPAWAVGLMEFTDGETGEIFYARRAHDCSLHLVRSPAEKRVLRFERKAAAVQVLGKRPAHIPDMNRFVRIRALKVLHPEAHIAGRRAFDNHAASRSSFGAAGS